jgi:hypothetical protein
MELVNRGFDPTLNWPYPLTNRLEPVPKKQFFWADLWGWSCE